jgi:hypothetical protein
VLSRGRTPLIKFVIPVVWIGCFAGVTLGLFLFPHAFRDESGQPPHASMKYWFLILTVVGWYFIYRSCMRLERVAIDDTSLYVSNYRTEIVVPLRDVERVHREPLGEHPPGDDPPAQRHRIRQPHRVHAAPALVRLVDVAPGRRRAARGRGALPAACPAPHVSRSRVPSAERLTPRRAAAKLRVRATPLAASRRGRCAANAGALSPRCSAPRSSRPSRRACSLHARAIIRS